MNMLLRKLLGYALLNAASDADAGGGGAAAGDAGDDQDVDAGRPDDISAEEWAQLSPAEREAIAAGDGDDADADALAAVAAAGDDPEAAAAATAAAAQAAEEEAAAAAAAGDPAPFVPVFKAALPEDFEAQVEALKTKRSDLRTQFKAGELELDDYEAQRETIDEKLGELNTLKVKADIAADNEKQTGEQRWTWECDTFYADEANAIYKDRLLAAAHNAAVIDLASEESLKAHPERAKWTGTRFLREADKLVRASMGVKPATPNPADDKAPRNLKPSPPDKIPPAISKLPVAAAAAVDGDEFAAIANLEGVEYERAIARMNPEQRERFMASA